jgi:predicted nuclease of restriction endonuclease-like RecB superfamily
LDACTFSESKTDDLPLLREKVFTLATQERKKGNLPTEAETRTRIFNTALNEMQLDCDTGEDLLYADLETERKLLKGPNWNPERFLQRYNIGLAQAVMLQAKKVKLQLPGATPQIKIRQLVRWLNFRRLLFTATKNNEGDWNFELDGPLSLFRSTTKYGLQLALLLPAVLLQKEFELEAELTWGKKNTRAFLHISSNDGLVSHLDDEGIYKPPEHIALMDHFKKKVRNLDISDEIGDMESITGLMVPDFIIKDSKTGKTIGVEILWAWNQETLTKKTEQLSKSKEFPYILAIHEKGNLGETKILEETTRNIIWFKSSPQVKQLADLATTLMSCI